MIEFHPITPGDKARYEECLWGEPERGCEFSFANLCLWGRQQLCFLEGQAVLFSQFNRRSVYPFPVGRGDKKKVIDAIISDAAQRGIPCRITGLTAQARQALEELYPGRFRYHCDRDSFDYVYAIDDLADLKGRKYQKKRNHYNRFRSAFPYYTVEPLTEENLPQVQAMVDQWYADRLREVPESDFHMERSALNKALRHYDALEMETLVLRDGQDVIALTMGSRLSPNTLDVHFEKARQDVDGAYTVINCEFARHIRQTHPDIQFLNREEDMGLEGLRKAKESYLPHHMTEKCWACLLEDGYDY